MMIVCQGNALLVWVTAAVADGVENKRKFASWPASRKNEAQEQPEEP